jgi:hypothetical protein
MKKIRLEDSIRNAFLLIKSGAHPAVVLFALRNDGLTSEKSKIIVRWAQVNSSAKRIAKIIDLHPVEEDV